MFLFPGFLGGLFPPLEGHTSRNLVGNAGEGGDNNRPSGKVKDGSSTTVAVKVLVRACLTLDPIEIWELSLVSHVAL